MNKCKNKGSNMKNKMLMLMLVLIKNISLIRGGK